MVKREGVSKAKEIKEPVAVFGVGVEGRSTIAYLLRQGVTRITALDRNEIGDLPEEIETVFGADHDQGLERFATIFRSPGIRPDHPSLTTAQEAGAVITSAVSHFLELCPAPTVGVTGTVGKGTAASLIAEMLKEDGFTVHLGGNIGASPLDFVADVSPEDRVVLEISSFQAMDIVTSPEIAVVLKTTSEHLDWHVDLDEYLDAKANLLAAQRPSDTVVFNADAPGSTRIGSSGSAERFTCSLIKEVDRGIFLKEDKFVLRRKDDDEVLPLRLDHVRIPGRFNWENLAAAILAAIAAGGTPETACRIAEQFEGLDHRLEFVAEGRGISFYNDSYATRPEAALGALSCFEDVPLALILGGSEKYADFEELAKAVVAHRHIVEVGLIGATAGRLSRILESVGPRKFRMVEYENLEPAMEGAVRALGDSGVVLLAPACASFGLFPNYKVRGERFRAKAKQLAWDLSNIS